MKACLWLPENDDAYRDKKEFINGQNTSLSFHEFKTQLTKEHPALKRKRSEPTGLRLLQTLLGLFNLVPYVVVKQIMKKFKDPVFKGSVNYLIGLVIFLLWWLFLGSIGLFLGNINISILLIFCSLTLLYLKQLLKIRYL